MDDGKIWHFGGRLNARRHLVRRTEVLEGPKGSSYLFPRPAVRSSVAGFLRWKSQQASCKSVYMGLHSAC